MFSIRPIENNNRPMLLQAWRAQWGGETRIYLSITNDNLHALGWYQRRGYRLAALRPGIVDEISRLLKPGISQLGENGFPIRDELELDKDLE